MILDFGPSWWAEVPDGRPENAIGVIDLVLGSYRSSQGIHSKPDKRDATSWSSLGFRNEQS
jgi:hypothetical protein